MALKLMLETLDNLIRDIVNTEYHDDVDEIERLTKELEGCVTNRARLVTCMKELDSVSADICNITTRMSQKRKRVEEPETLPALQTTSWVRCPFCDRFESIGGYRCRDCREAS